MDMFIVSGEGIMASLRFDRALHKCAFDGVINATGRGTYERTKASKSALKVSASIWASP
jgi:hypothetical protein